MEPLDDNNMQQENLEPGPSSVSEARLTTPLLSLLELLLILESLAQSPQTPCASPLHRPGPLLAVRTPRSRSCPCHLAPRRSPHLHLDSTMTVQARRLEDSLNLLAELEEEHNVIIRQLTEAVEENSPLRDWLNVVLT